MKEQVKLQNQIRKLEALSAGHVNQSLDSTLGEGGCVVGDELFADNPISTQQLYDYIILMAKDGGFGSMGDTLLHSYVVASQGSEEDIDCLFEVAYGLGANVSSSSPALRSRCSQVYDRHLSGVAQVSDDGVEYLPRAPLRAVWGIGVVPVQKQSAYAVLLGFSAGIRMKEKVTDGTIEPKVQEDDGQNTVCPVETPFAQIAQRAIESWRKAPISLLDGLIPAVRCSKDLVSAEAVIAYLLSNFASSRLSAIVENKKQSKQSRSVTVTDSRGKVTVFNNHDTVWDKVNVDGAFPNALRIASEPEMSSELLKGCSQAIRGSSEIRSFIGAREHVDQLVETVELAVTHYLEKPRGSNHRDIMTLGDKFVGEIIEAWTVLHHCPEELTHLIGVKVKRYLNKEVYALAERLAYVELARDILFADCTRGHVPVDIVEMVYGVVLSYGHNDPTVLLSRHDIIQTEVINKAECVAFAAQCACSRYYGKYRKRCAVKKGGKDNEARVPLDQDVSECVVALVLSSNSLPSLETVESLVENVGRGMESGEPMTIVHVACPNYSDTWPVTVLVDRMGNSFAESVVTMRSVVKTLLQYGVPVRSIFVYADDEISPQDADGLSLAETAKQSFDVICTETMGMFSKLGSGVSLSILAASSLMQFRHSLGVKDRLVSDILGPDVSQDFQKLRVWLRRKAEHHYKHPSRFHKGKNPGELFGLFALMAVDYYLSMLLVQDVFGTDIVYLGMEKDPTVVWLFGAGYGSEFPAPGVPYLNIAKGKII